MKMKKMILFYLILYAGLFCTDLLSSPIVVELPVHEDFPRWYEHLKVVIEEPSRVGAVIMMFLYKDGKDIATKGEAEALEWTRKAMAMYGDDKNIIGFGSEYLARKGDERDIPFLKQYEDGHFGDILEKRLAGINIFNDPRIQYPNFIPSVTNMGPQAAYVREILRKAWNQSGKDVSKIPSELISIVVSFDKNGNPVSSVSLSKYGLSMPYIEPKPTADDNHFNPQCTVAFPHEQEGYTPPITATASPQDEPPPPSVITRNGATKQPTPDDATATPPTPSSSRLWLYIAIPLLAVIGGITAWKLKKT